MSFREYIETRRAGANPEGDFVTDARGDRKLPDARTWAQLRSYLSAKGAAPEAIEAGHNVWKAYQAKQRKAKR